MLAIATIHETITDESAAVGDVASSDMSDAEPVSFRDALDALKQGCWDNVDWRATEVIAYPADWHQDMRTGDYDADTLVIRGPEHQLARLARAYDH